MYDVPCDNGAICTRTREKKYVLYSKIPIFKATVLSQWNKSFEEDMKLSHKLPKWKSYILDALNLILMRVLSLVC